jgi:hypothetical protein
MIDLMVTHAILYKYAKSADARLLLARKLQSSILVASLFIYCCLNLVVGFVSIKTSMSLPSKGNH